MLASSLSFSIRFPPTQSPEPLMRSARLAEEAGFDGIWMVDTPLIAGELFDPYVDLTVCALQTSRVRLGPAVSTFALRHLVATGAAILGLDRVSGGRAILGLGTGGSALVTLGLLTGHQGAFVANSTRQRRDDLRQAIPILRKLFAGEPVGFGSRTIQLPRPHPIPIYLAASGQRALALAGEMADGVIMQVGVEPATLRRAIEVVRQSAERAGRDPAGITLVCSTFAVVSHDRRDDIDRVRPLASYFYSAVPAILEQAGVPVEKRFPDWVPTPDLTHAYDWDDAMAAARTYIPDDVVERFCLVGPPADARQRLVELSALGIDEVFLRWSSSYALPDPLIELFDREIIPAFQSSSR